MDSTACRFFQSPNGCFRGDSCTFRHEYAPGTAPPADDPKDPASLASGVDNIVISASNPYAHGNSAASALRPCRFYTAATGCRNGPQCPFAHMAPQGMMAYGGMEEQAALDYANAMYYQPPPGGMMPLPPVMAPMMLTDPPLPGTGGMHLQMPSQMGHSNGSGGSPTQTNSGNDSSSSSSATSGNGAPRRPLTIQANPSKSSNYEVISEILPVLTREIEGPVRISCISVVRLTCAMNVHVEGL